MDAMKTYKIAVLDDYQNAALKSADWSVLGQRADITVFKDHLADPQAVIERLLPFDVICVMRERSPMPRNIIERLPNLGSPREFVRRGILRGFPGFLKSDIFGVGHGHAPCFQ
jgi:hypothetical protein